MGQNGNGLKTDKNGNRTEIKRERNGITRPVVRMGDGNFFLTPTVKGGGLAKKRRLELIIGLPTVHLAKAKVTTCVLDTGIVCEFFFL